MSNTEEPTQALAVQSAPLSLEQIYKLGGVLAASNYFTSTKTAAQAVVKILAGRELGIPPMAAMAGIYIIDGKTSLSATLIGTLIQNSGRFAYRVRRSDAAAAEIEFFEHGEALGVSSFTIQEAQTAGLTGKDNWRHYPKALLFSRALTQGARTYTPGIFGGVAVYAPEELQDGVNPDTGEIVEATFSETPEVPPITAEQKRAINAAFAARHMNGPARKDWLDHYHLPALGDLTAAQAEAVLGALDEEAEAATIAATTVAEASAA